MEYRTERLILRAVTEDDMEEVRRTWPSGPHPLTAEDARAVIARMERDRGKNTAGSIHHLCLAVCRAEDPRTLLGWCGLDGTRSSAEPEIFILLEEEHRGRGFGTECVRELLRIATADFRLHSVHGGCSRDNPASRRAMEKGGMVFYGTEDNGDPLFRYPA